MENIPKKIIVDDNDGGYYIAELQIVDQLVPNPPTYIYKVKEYYHQLKDALKEFE